MANGSAKIAFGTHGCSVAGCHVLRISCYFCYNLLRCKTSIAFKWVQHDWWTLLGWCNPLLKLLHIWNNINVTQGNSSNQKGNLLWGIQVQAYTTKSIVEVVPEISQCIFKFRFCCYIYIYMYVYISLISLQEWSAGHEKYHQNLYFVMLHFLLHSYQSSWQVAEPSDNGGAAASKLIVNSEKNGKWNGSLKNTALVHDHKWKGTHTSLLQCPDKFWTLIPTQYFIAHPGLSKTRDCSH